MMATGILPNKTSDNIDLLWWVAFIGFIFNGVGVFFGHLFAADVKDVKRNSNQIEDIKAQMSQVPNAVETHDTNFLRSSINKANIETKENK